MLGPHIFWEFIFLNLGIWALLKKIVDQVCLAFRFLGYPALGPRELGSVLLNVLPPPLGENPTAACWGVTWPEERRSQGGATGAMALSSRGPDFLKILFFTKLGLS